MSLVYFHQQQGNFHTNRRELNIVNDHYSHYGNSVLVQSKSVLSSQRTRTSSSIISNAAVSPNTSRNSSRHAVKEFQPSDHDTVTDLTTETFKRQKLGYRSLLLTQADSKVKRFLNRLDTDTFSLFSSKSHSVQQPTTIGSLPVEILSMVISLVGDYKTTISCLYVSKQFNKAATPVVYSSPVLNSTYRVAQLVSSLKETGNGQWVKSLDLSHLEPGLIPDEDYKDDDNNSISSDHVEYALASWRDWKYKDDPLYGSNLLNSYTLSKSKSAISCDSNFSTASSFTSKIMTRLKSSDRELTRMGQRVKKMFKWKAKIKRTRSSISKKDHGSGQQTLYGDGADDSNIGITCSVKFQVKDMKNQPFSAGHPFTNKFLLKYANSKDLPIGYILLFIDLCPNLQSLNLSNLSLSDDFQIVYRKPNVNSLIESVIPAINTQSNDCGLQIDHYFSDRNIHFNDKHSHTEFHKLHDTDILVKLSQLESLRELSMCNLPWLNYRVIRGSFIQSSVSMLNGTLKCVDFTNSGMVRDLRWAKAFTCDELDRYFQPETEPIIEEENEHDVLVRGIGMNY